MSQTRRKWSEVQKFQIIQESEQFGVASTLRKYNLAQSLFQRWRRAYHGTGMDGLRPQYKTIDPELRQLRQENDRLKMIVANQALELEFKTELLKKSR